MPGDLVDEGLTIGVGTRFLLRWSGERRGEPFSQESVLRMNTGRPHRDVVEPDSQLGGYLLGLRAGDKVPVTLHLGRSEALERAIEVLAVAADPAWVGPRQSTFHASMA